MTTKKEQATESGHVQVNAPSSWNMRIWDEGNHEWLRSHDKNALAYVGFDIRGGEVATIQGMDWVYDAIFHGRNLIFERSTGLADKNGKEIYEGDIVNLEYYAKRFGKKRWNKTYPRKGGIDINIVSFDDGYFKFHKEDKDGYGSELAFSDYGEWESKDGAYKYVAEVIGNIHQNPELIGADRRSNDET